jgi:hypothetical protein
LTAQRFAERVVSTIEAEAFDEANVVRSSN